MYNWKLSAFFIIGLILVTGVFSNAAMAAADDGKGEVIPTWGFRAIDSPDIGTASSDATSDVPLGAGSTHNVLQFTYTADDATKAINMAGGRFRVTFPSGWKVSNKLIKVTDGDAGNVVYQTDAKGDLNLAEITGADGTLDTDEKKKAAANAVTFEADRSITVNLGSEWSSSRSTGRQLVIILSDVTVPIPSRLTENDTILLITTLMTMLILSSGAAPVPGTAH